MLVFRHIFKQQSVFVRAISKCPGRIWATSDDGSIVITSLKAERVQDAVELARKSFFPYETVCKAVELAKSPEAMREMEQLVLKVAADGVSVTAVDKKCGRIIAMAVNKLWVRKGQTESSFFKDATQHWKEEPSKVFAQFLTDGGSNMEIFDYNTAQCVLEPMFTMVEPDIANRQIGMLLIKGTMAIVDELRAGVNVRTSIDGSELEILKPEAIIGYATSLASMKSALRLGYTEVDRKSFSSFIKGNQKLLEKLGDGAFLSVVQRIL